MKVKILLFPFLFILIMVGIIWFVYPAYTSPEGGMREKQAQLKIEDAKVNALASEVDNIRALSDDITKNSDKKDILFQFLPMKINEEYIINDINSIAADSKLGIDTISVEKISSGLVNDLTGAEEMGVALASAPTDPSSGAVDAGLMPQAVPIPKAVPGSIDVNVKMLGDYGAMKAFLEKLHKLKRFNNMNVLKIEHVKDNEGKAISLAMDALLRFNFYKKSENLANMESIKFPRSKFDMAIVNQITQARNTTGPAIEPGTLGRNDPFAP